MIASDLDAFAVDFRKVFEERKRKLGKHYGREKIFEDFQDPGFQEFVLVRDDGCGMSWVINARSIAEASTHARTFNRIPNIWPPNQGNI